MVIMVGGVYRHSGAAPRRIRHGYASIMAARTRPTIAASPMVLIPAVTFTMGDDASARADERPAHRVALAAFRAAVAPVTNAEYARFLDATGREAPPFMADARFGAEAQPVVGVSWFDAVA
jgi:formylglycine-generating enzyme required for sulfatase activity